MTVFYRGLLELSKSFLDPFGDKRVSSKFIIQTLDRKRKNTLPLFCFNSVGVMTLFYRGLLELSKSFLDPFGNKLDRSPLYLKKKKSVKGVVICRCVCV